MSMSMEPSALPSSIDAASQSDEVVPAVVATPLVLAVPPPWHTIAAMGLIVSIFVYSLPSMDELDQVAKVDTFTKIVFPDFLDLPTLAYMRFLIALSIGFTSFYLVFLSEGWEQATVYRKGSKLIMTANRLSGIKTMFPFTSLAWNLLGLSFALNAYIAMRAASKQQVSVSILRAAVILWEIAAPFTLLVASVIRYVIWPTVLKTNGKTEQLKSWRNVMMHNMNVLFAISEAVCMGAINVEWSHVGFAPLVGALYVIFSWAMVHQWNEPDKGPQFIYFFFDTTLPGYTCTISLLLLLLVLVIFYGIFCVCGQVLRMIGGGLVVRLGFVAVVSRLVMRFRD